MGPRLLWTGMLAALLPLPAPLPAALAQAAQ